MPQVSVIPAKISPAPTNADNPMNAGWTNQPSNAPSSTSEPAAIRTCRSSEMAFLPRRTGRPVSTQAIVPPLDVDDVQETGLDELLAGLLTSATGTTNNIQRLISRSITSLHQRRDIELVQWDVSRAFDMELAEFDRRPHVDEVDFLSCLPQFGKLLRFDDADAHGLLLASAPRQGANRCFWSQLQIRRAIWPKGCTARRK